MLYCISVAILCIPREPTHAQPISDLRASLAGREAITVGARLTNIRRQILQRTAESGHSVPDEYLISLIKLERDLIGRLERSDQARSAIGKQAPSQRKVPTLENYREIISERLKSDLEKDVSLLKLQIVNLESENSQGKYDDYIRVLCKHLQGQQEFLNWLETKDSQPSPIPMLNHKTSRN